jgi:hypothetical protein
MEVIGTTVAMLFVVGVLATVAFALFEMSPFAHHSDEYRDATTGKKLGQPPRLD